MLIIFFVVSLLLLPLFSNAQNIENQSVQGRVVDKATQEPLSGVLIYVEDTNPVASVFSDADGFFWLASVPLGRQTIKAEGQGYATFYTDNLMVRPSKQVYLSIELRKAFKASKNGWANDVRENLPINQSSIASTRSFSAEEANRYPGSLDDIGRMTLAFPGVQSVKDNENDIIVRGNYSNRSAWRLEGLDVPNLNQFARIGGGSGAISILNAALLGSSDFISGTPAAEYGNAQAGVFDLNFRDGNLYNREYSVWVDLFSIGASTNGPIKKGQSSYLVNYRYSTLGVLGALGLPLVRENATFTFQDLSFNLKFHSKDRKHSTSLFGIGGKGDGIWTIKEDTTDWLARLDYTSIDYHTGLGVIGLTHRYKINTQSYLKFGAGGSATLYIDNQEDGLNGNQRITTNEYTQFRYNLMVDYYNKLTDVVQLKAGIKGTGLIYDLNYQDYDYNKKELNTLLSDKGYSTFLIQSYLQATFNIGSRVKINTGVHAMLFTLNNSYTVEPRFSVQYQMTKSSKLYGAYGLHGKTLPIGTYLLNVTDENGIVGKHNLNLPIPQAHQATVGFRQTIGENVLIQTEFYYQRTFNAPISADSARSYWLYNYRDHYGSTAMTANSVGENYGVELMVEKAFRRGYFILGSASLFRSQYITPEGERRSTSTDNLYLLSLSGGKEFSFKKGLTLQIGLKAMLRGGKRYVPADLDASILAERLILDDNQGFAEHSKPYFRLDARIAIRKDMPKWSFMFEIVAQNATLYRNLLELEYNRIDQSITERMDAGILPFARFQIDF